MTLNPPVRMWRTSRFSHEIKPVMIEWRTNRYVKVLNGRKERMASLAHRYSETFERAKFILLADLRKREEELKKYLAEVEDRIKLVEAQKL